tara:strand:+ start:2465 stop:3184 length:720 start_codon:yes stop_codon:yes gene_type:complete
MIKNTFILIPSRIGSTRLKNKPLIDLQGKSIIQRAVLNALSITENTYVATDSNLIKQNVFEISKNVIMTSSEHISGTDRICEAATKLDLDEDTLILNLQGDEPFIPSDLVIKVINEYHKNQCDVITVSTLIKSDYELTNQNCVLVETDMNGYATNFVRTGNIEDPKRHIGIYGYSFKTLNELVKLKPTKSELSLKLEQLRFLENNYSIYVSEYDEQIPNGIDTQEDVENALNFLKNENL